MPEAQSPAKSALAVSPHETPAPANPPHAAGFDSSEAQASSAASSPPPTQESEAAPQASGEPSEPASPAASAKQVPVTEAIRYRKRAQTAEQQLEALQFRFASLQQQFDESQQTITALERRQKIDTLLADSDAIDFEAARLLTEVAVGQMDEPDLALAVEDLRRDKPYLFRRRASADAPPASAMGARLDEPPPHHHAAAHAAATGDRRDLLDYLRLRRAT